MQLAGGKLIAALVGTAIIGGGVTGGFIALNDKKDTAQSTTSPSPVASVSPSPSVQLSTPTASGNKPAIEVRPSEQDQIVAAARVYAQALVAGRPDANNQLTAQFQRTDGTFAVVNASDGNGGFFILLKKGSGGWVGFASGNGTVDPAIAADWGLPKSFFPWDEANAR